MIDTPEELLKKAEAGDEYSQHYASEGYADGKYGFPQSTEKLLECADKGWKSAKGFVSQGYAQRKFGFKRDIAKAEEYGWPKRPDKNLDLQGMFSLWKKYKNLFKD